MTGQMLKKGYNTQKHMWKSKWFVLLASELIYYESKEMKTRKVLHMFIISFKIYDNELCSNACKHKYT